MDEKCWHQGAGISNLAIGDVAIGDVAIGGCIPNIGAIKNRPPHDAEGRS